MDRGAWRDTAPGLTKTQTPLSTYEHLPTPKCHIVKLLLSVPFFFRIFTYFIKSLQSVIIIKYTTIYKDYIHFAQTFTSQYIVSLRNIVYIYHQTIKSNNSSVTAPVSTDIFFINYIIRKYTAVNWAFKNVFYKI